MTELDKASALAHLLAVAHGGNTQALRDHAMQALGTCTDMGAELGFSGLRTPLLSLVPEWSASKQDRLTADVPEAGMDDAGPAADFQLAQARIEAEEMEIDDCGMDGALPLPSMLGQSNEDLLESYFLPNSAPVAGLEHVCDNALEHMHQTLSHWSVFFSRLQNLSSLLHHRYRRERFAAACLHGTPLAPMADLFDKFGGKLYDKRWHNVLLFVKRLEPLLAVLRSFSAAKYNSVGNERGQAGDAQFNPEAAQEALQDEHFHAYCMFVLRLDSIPFQLAQWSRGCACHNTVRQCPRLHAVAMEAHFPETHTCPMQGLHASEFACGKVTQMLDGLMETATSQVVLAFSHVLSEDKMHTIILDFSSSSWAVAVAVVVETELLNQLSDWGFKCVVSAYLTFPWCVTFFLRKKRSDIQQTESNGIIPAETRELLCSAPASTTAGGLVANDWLGKRLSVHNLLLEWLAVWQVHASARFPTRCRE